ANYTPLVADLDRHFFSIGTGFKGERFNFDVAYQFGYGPPRTVTGSASSAARQTADGRYEFISHAIALTLGWHFCHRFASKSLLKAGADPSSLNWSKSRSDRSAFSRREFVQTARSNQPFETPQITRMPASRSIRLPPNRPGTTAPFL